MQSAKGVFAVASDGNAIGFNLQDLDTNADPPSATLTLASTGEYIGVLDARVLQTVANPERFSVHASGRDVTIRAANGQWLTWDGTSRFLTSSPRPFRLHDIDPGFVSRSCCCGVRPATDGPGIAWNDRRHEKIVCDAVAKVGNTKGNGINAAHAKIWGDSYWTSATSEFAKKVLAGLKEADYKDEYTGVLPGVGQIYYKHFYDPDTRSTFSTYTENAMTEFCRHFYASVAEREAGEKNNAAYSLGLALHYLTDLTQPMHAARFINFPPLGDKRHAGFEEASESTAYDYASDTEMTSYDLTRWHSLGQLFTEVAQYSKNVFNEHVAGPASRKVTWYPYYDMVIEKYDNSWSDEEVKPIVSRMLPYAITISAAVLIYWTGASMYAFVDSIYRRVLGRAPQTVDGSGLQTWGGYLRNGATMQWIVRQIALSDESIAGIAAGGSVDDQIRLLFRRLLARDAGEPDLAAWRGWIGAKRYADSINYIIDSPEYNQRFGPYVLPY